MEFKTGITTAMEKKKLQIKISNGLSTEVSILPTTNTVQPNGNKFAINRDGRIKAN